MSLGHIGRYDLLAPLGRGGMAEVYLARPEGDPRSVVYALKSILPDFANDPRFVQMFHRELTIATGLCHPNLVSVLDHGREHGRHFMLMEYVHGPDLADVLRTAGCSGERPPLDGALSVVLAVARGLHHLHEWPGKHGGAPGFVHRDVSPSNVLLGYDGTVKVTDFGVATATAHTRTTDAGGVKGKMGYLSPEQCRSEGLDRRSDVYALGVLLYETTLGERLFYGDNDYAVMHQIISGKYSSPLERDLEYPAELEQIISRALRGDKDARHPTAEAFADEVEAFADARGLALGRDAVARWVTSLVEWKPYPAFAPPAPNSAPVTAVSAVSAPPAPRRSRLPLVAALALPAAIGGLTVALLHAREPEEMDAPAPDRPVVRSDAPAPPPPPQPVEPQVEPVPLVAPEPQPQPQPQPEIEPEPEPEPEPDPEPEIEPEPEPRIEPASETAERVPAKRRRKRRKKQKPSPRYDLDAPRPPR